MGTPRKVGGYIWRQEVARATSANRRAREKLSRILEERPGPTRLALLLAEMAQQLSINLEALVALDGIGNNDGGEHGSLG